MAATHANVHADKNEYVEPTGWVGWVAFAGIMMLMLGMFHGFQGFVALLNNGYYAVTKNGLLIQVDYTTWGWTHIVWALVLIATGIGLMAGQTWARFVGVIVVAVSALINISFMSAYPLWSTLMLVLDGLVIFAIVVHGREIRDQQ